MLSFHSLAAMSLGAALLLATVPAGAAPADGHKTDWFSKAGYGVFVHYLNGLQNNRDQIHSLGRQTSWDACVREFDTERFAQTMSDVGARYVIFSVMQISRFMIAPNATFDRISGYKPGQACATRDLVADLYRSLSKRKIRLMLYWTGDGPRSDPKAGPAFNCGSPVSMQFVTKWASVAEEYSRRYGRKISGWWVDGSYDFIGWDQPKLAIAAKALRAGNPDTLVAFNPGVDPAVRAYSPHEDYTCGEQNRFSDMPVQRFINGEQWHILSFLGPGWAQPGCQYTKVELADYVMDANRRGGVVSVDVLVYRDGSLDRSQVEVLKAVARARREGKMRTTVPPGNLAFGKQARLLSLDGSHELTVNSGVHFPRLGVDGHKDTTAAAGGEWPWTYEVDLVDTVPLRRVKVTFGTGYATSLEVRVSTDRVNWKTVAAASDLDGKPYEVEFKPVAARYLRICALKPDGPGQKGAQMSVAELEAYR